MHTRFGQYIKEKGLFNYRMESVGYSLKKDMRTYQKFNKYLKNNIRWLVKGELSNTLKELLDSIEESKNWVVVRSSSFRKVLNYTHNQESFYIKQYIVKSNLEAIKSLVSISKVQREWNKGNLLLKNNLLTAEPVAVGEKRCFGMLKESYIISRTIPDSIPLRERLVNTQQLSAEYRQINKNTLLRKFISYIKMIHEHGFFHGELHAENILVGQNDYTFYLIDVGRIKFRKRLPEPWKIYDLARFFYSVLDICTNNEMAELIDNYASNTLTTKDKKIFHKSVFDEIYKIKRRLWNGRTKKCLKDNTVFKITTYGRYTINMRREWDVNTLVDLINKHILSFKIKSDNVIKSSSKTGITQIRVANENTESVCIKEYRYPSFLKKIIYSFFRSSARKAWFAAHGILALNFLTPQPIALIEEKRFSMLKRSFLIMEDISDFLPCYKYVSEKFSCYDKVTVEKKQIFVSCLAASLRQFHDSGVYHSDLKGSNIMITELPDTWNIFYIDLDRVYFNKRITLKKKIKNLTQLNASMPNCITYTDRLRFYRTYTGIKKLNDKDKQILRSIIQFSIQRNHFWKPKLKGI